MFKITIKKNLVGRSAVKHASTFYVGNSLKIRKKYF